LFYAADPARLRQDVESLLIGPASFSHRPKALIAPHAGYVYSGAVAGKAFAPLRGAARDITRVVVIGPAHWRVAPCESQSDASSRQAVSAVVVRGPS
jgi:AmmeMemoRadiSam system protein B